jgi:hypothetical protein
MASFNSLLLFILLLQLVSAQYCSFWNTGCIDSLAQTAVRFDLNPLFPDPVTLYYSFDASPSGKGEGPMTKTAFWLGYPNHNINKNAVDSNRTSEIGLRIGNMTGTPSGSNNGCDGIWGSDCSRDFKSSLQHSMFRLATSGEYYSKPLEVALNQMLIKPPPLPSCPPPILDVASIPVQGKSGLFARSAFISNAFKILPESVFPIRTLLSCHPGRALGRGRSGIWTV